MFTFSETMDMFIVCLIFSSALAVDPNIDFKNKHKEKVCYGTNNDFSSSGNVEFHYESLRRRYTGCNYVDGNLEITNLDGEKTFDLGFLATIKVVTGYVLLGNLNVNKIPLTELRFIRADDTMEIGGKQYGLVVALNYKAGISTPEIPVAGLKELQLPALREISRGDVFFTQNPLLCHVDQIDWSRITNQSVKFGEGMKSENCGVCSDSCPERGGVTRCWGQGSNMCQHISTFECDPKCNGACYDGGCCHAQCAVGCYGYLDVDCEMCRHFRYDQKCVTRCPHGTYAHAQECVPF